MTNHRRRRVIAAGCWLVLVLALMPAVTYMGHWPAGAIDNHHAGHESSTASDHEVHCHGGVARCAGGEAMVGTTWAGEETTMLSLTSPYFQVETRDALTAVEGEPSRILQPPRSA